MKKYYAYFAFGREDVLNQCLFSMISLFQKDKIHERNDTKIIVYTDQPEYFKKFFKEGSEFLDLQHKTMDELKSWMHKPGNEHKNLHRIKLKSLEDIFLRYPEGYVILLDSDTYLLDTLQPYFDRLKGNETFMHKDEGSVWKGKSPGLRWHRRFFKTHNLNMDGQPFILPKTFHMFNAGVVGMGPQYSWIIKKMLNMHDQIFEKTKYYNAEQFSLGYWLQTNTQLRPTDNVIRHYWYLKEFQGVMDKFVVNSKQKSFKEILATPLPTAKMPSFEGFKKLNFIIPYKFKKKMYQLGLRKTPYVTFE